MNGGDPAEEATRRADEEARRADEAEWRKKERKLRKREVTSQFVGAWAQLLIGLAAILAAVVAIIAAYVAYTAVQATQLSIQRQTDESRLNTAVTAIGGTTPADRVAGVELLRRHVDERLAAAAGTALNSWDRQDARGLYTSALIVLSNYTPRVQPGGNVACALPRPLDVQYAADELKQLLAEKDQFMALEPGSKPPGVDLSYAGLCDQSWSGVRFDGLSSAWLLGIDLRGSDLERSQWGTATLTDAQLQCADLQGANLSHATLTGADLRGANLAGAQLPHTLTTAQRVSAVWTPTASWDPSRCLTNGYRRS